MSDPTDISQLGLDQSGEQVRLQTLQSDLAAHRARRAASTTVPPVLTELANQREGEAAAGAALQGEVPSSGTLQSAAASDQPVEQQVASTPVQPQPTVNSDMGVQLAEDASNLQEDQENIAHNSGVTDKLAATIRENTLTASVIRAIAAPHFAVDPNFDYVGKLQDIETDDLSPDQIDWLRQSQSQQDLDFRRDRIAQENQDSQALGVNGGVANLIWDLAGGALDPAGWAITGGVGKVTQMAAIAARGVKTYSELSMAGRVATQGLAAAGTGVASEAALQAAGEKVDLHDYARAAGMGLVFAAGQGAAKLPLQFAQHARNVGERMQQEAADRAAATYARASQEAGPGASPEDIKAKVDEVHRWTVEQQYQWLLSDPDEGDVVKWGHGKEAQPAEGGVGQDTRSNVLGDQNASGSGRRTWASVVDLARSRGWSVVTSNKPSNWRFDRKAKRLTIPPEGHGDYRVAAHELGHALLVDSANGGRVTAEQIKGVSNYDQLLDLSKQYRPEQHEHASAKVRAHARKPDEVLADAMAMVLHGRADPSVLDPFLKATGRTRDQVGLPPGGNPPNPPGLPVAGEEGPDRGLPVQGPTAYGDPLDTSVSSDINRPFIRQLYQYAKDWRAGNDVNPIKTVLQKVRAESTGLTMLSSKNPILNYVGAVLGESTAGGVARRRTAAMLKTMLYNRYFKSTENEYEHLFNAWTGRRGGLGGAWDDLVRGNDRDAFDRAVYALRENRRLQQAAKEGRTQFSPLSAPEQLRTNDKIVARAADLLDETYGLMAQHQRDVGTIGAGGLKNTSVGYTPRRFDPAKMLNLPQRYREAYIQAMAEQLVEGNYFDMPFARRLATNIIARGNRRAKGTFDVPAAVYSKEGGDVVQEALDEMDLTPQQRAEAERRYARGGARYTKQRMDLDVNRRYQIGNGESVALSDLLDFNQVGLLRSYANRASGEVALAKYGIAGAPGARLIREALVADNGEFGGVTQHELRAYDHFMSEMFGIPIASRQNELVDNVTGLASLARLGGMGLPQIAEYTNSVAALGVGRAATAIPSFGRVYKELRSLSEGKPVNNEFLSSWENLVGPAGMEEFHAVGLQHARNQPELYDGQAVSTFSRIVRSGQNLQAKLAFHKAISGVQVRWATEQIIKMAADAALDGKATAAMKDMGITDEMLAELQSSGAFSYNGKRAVGFDATKVDDNQVLADFLQAAKRGAGQIIQQTLPGETGQYTGTSIGRMLTQFRSYGLTSIEKQWGRQVRTFGYARAFGYLLGSMSVAAPIYMARVYINAATMDQQQRKKYLARAATPAAIAEATLNYVSLSGLTGDVLDAGSALTGRNVIGGRTGSAPGGIVDSFVPAAGLLDDAASGVGGANPHKLLHALPFSNLPYLQPVLSGIEGQLQPVAKRVRQNSAAEDRAAAQQWYNQPLSN